MRILLFITLLIVGFCLRVALHDVHGLEGDDGVTLHLLPIETGTLIEGLRRQELDVHPPLYFVLLQAWTNLAGDSLISLRLLNILADLLAGALLLRLLGRVLQLRVALTAGLLWLCAPLVLYTLYPVRMYPLLSLFVTGGAVCVAEILAAKNRLIGRVFHNQIFLHLQPFLILFFCTLAALYTHIFGALAAGAYAVAFGIAGLRRTLHWRELLLGWGVIILAGMLFLPFGLPMLARLMEGSALGAQASASPGNAWEIPGQLLLVMVSHRVLTNSLAGTAIFVIVLVGSIYFVFRTIKRENIELTTQTQSNFHIVYLFILIWTMLGGAIFLAIVADIYRPRYVAPFVPLLLAAISVLIGSVRWRFVRAAIILLMVLISGAGVVDNLRSDAYDDWRAAAQFLEKMADSGDKIVIIPAWGAKAFGYHYEGDVPVASLLPGITPDVDLDPLLSETTAGYDRVWLVRYQVDVSDPTHRADHWFRERAVTITEVYPTAIQVKGYDFNPTLSELPAFVRPLDVSFEGVMALRGIDMPVTQGSGRDRRLHPPSNWIYLTLYMEKLHARSNLALRVRLTDLTGNTWGAPIDRDNDLIHRQPLDSWELNTLYEAAFDLNLNPTIPPGDYYIEVMVLDAVTGTPLNSTGADAGDSWAIVGKFTVTAGG